MPELSYFYGIHIRINFNDHNPPQFHAVYGEHEAQVRIVDGGLEDGSLPGRAHRLVRQWLDEHRSEVWAAWNDAQELKSPGKIDPLP